MIRAVLDTNVIVSGVIQPAGAPAQLLRLAIEEQRFVLVASLPILAEVGEVLRRPRIVRRHGWGEREISLFLARLYMFSLVTEGRLSLDVVVDDPSDNMFLAAAKEGEAEYVVSGDRHLLQLDAYEGILIVPPRRFLELLSEDAT